MHVYDADPDRYLTFRKRAWCKAICAPGDSEIVLNNLAAEGDSVKSILGDLGDLQLKLGITTFVATPISEEFKPVYRCFLTRINSVEVTLGDHNYEIRKNRTLVCSAGDPLGEISKFVAENLSIPKDSVEATPPADPDPEEVEAGDEPEVAPQPVDPV